MEFVQIKFPEFCFVKIKITQEWWINDFISNKGIEYIKKTFCKKFISSFHLVHCTVQGDNNCLEYYACTLIIYQTISFNTFNLTILIILSWFFQW